MLPDYYALLGVREDATEEEIRRAHRKKLLEVHPDRHPGAESEEVAKRLGEARQILLDPKARALYDLRRRPGAPIAEGTDVADIIKLIEAAAGVDAEQVLDSLVDLGRGFLRRKLRGE